MNPLYTIMGQNCVIPDRPLNQRVINEEWETLTSVPMVQPPMGWQLLALTAWHGALWASMPQAMKDRVDRMASELAVYYEQQNNVAMAAKLWAAASGGEVF